MTATQTDDAAQLAALGYESRFERGSSPAGDAVTPG
jgi:hypothetical protein